MILLGPLNIGQDFEREKTAEVVRGLYKEPDGEVAGSVT